MTYDIRTNTQYNSREVYFDAKPSEEVREGLKALKMRWNRKKACWYGFASEAELITALNGAGEAVTTEGYLGAGAYYGAKSRQYLHGAELSKAVRADLKASGVSGCSVSCKTYSMGQTLTVKVKFTPDDLAPLEELKKAHPMPPQCCNWIQYKDNNGETQSIRFETWAGMQWNEEATAIYEGALLLGMENAAEGATIYAGNIDGHKEYTQQFRDKLAKVYAIATAYNYDESNIMVDYFNTNFYLDIVTVPEK